MKILFIIFILLLIPNFVSADEKSTDIQLEKYRSYGGFIDSIKNQSHISDDEKYKIIDEETSTELKSKFIYTDLDNCIKIAINKNYELKITKDYKQQSKYLYKNALFQLLPDAFYNFSIGTLSGEYLVGGILSREINEIPIQSQFAFNWSTINQGKYFFLVAKQKNELKSSNAKLEFKKEEIIKNTVLAYYETLEKKLEVEVQKVNLFERYEQLKYTKARFETGLGTLYDVKRAQQELAAAQQEYIKIINLLRLKQASLANILGLNVLDAIYPIETSVRKRMLVNSNCKIEELYKQAILSRKDIKSKKAEIEAYKAKRSANYTDIIPDINISYQNGLVGTHRAGLSDHNSIMLDTKFHLGKNMLLGTVTQIKADNAVLQAKKHELEYFKRNIKEEILSSYYDSINCLKRIEASEVETEAANLSFDLSLANMQAGEATFIDVISSQNLKVSANIKLIKNMIEYNKIQTKLLFEIGLITPESVLKDYKSQLN